MEQWQELEAFKARLDVALGSLGCWLATLHIAGVFYKTLGEMETAGAAPALLPLTLGWRHREVMHGTEIPHCQ